MYVYTLYPLIHGFLFLYPGSEKVFVPKRRDIMSSTELNNERITNHIHAFDALVLTQTRTGLHSIFYNYFPVK